MWFVLRTAEGNLKAMQFANAEEARPKLIEYLNGPEPPTVYRVIDRQDGDILLRRLRVNPATVVTREVIDTADFEDDV